MTPPRARAEEIIQQLTIGDPEVWLAKGEPEYEEFISLIAAALSAAVEAEREAWIDMLHNRGLGAAADEIAAIRAR